MYSARPQVRTAPRIARRSRRRFLVLAPAGAGSAFGRVQVDHECHARFLKQAQILRGQVYVQGAFLGPDELSDGRHHAAGDQQSWHLLLLDSRDNVCGCIRFRQHRNSIGYAHLTVSHSAIARCSQWGESLRSGIEEQLALARHRELSFVEIGGWALAESARGSSEAARMALATFALSQLIGGAVGIATAREHCAAPILRKIGGQSLNSLPPFHEPTYRCTIEILRFYSWDPNPRFEHWIDELKDELQTATVVSKALPAAEWMLPGHHPVCAPPAATLREASVGTC